jgi:hypothetical protein
MELSSSDEKTWQLVLKDYEMALETQRHFNDLIMRFRTIMFTVIGVFTSAAVGAYNIHPVLTIVMLFVTFFLLHIFRKFDRDYYHRLLLGAVQKTTEIDALYKDVQVDFLGKSTRVFGLSEYITNKVRAKKEEISKESHKSIPLINQFYWFMTIILGLLLIAVVWYGLTSGSLNKGWKSEKDSGKDGAGITVEVSGNDTKFEVCTDGNR